MSMQGDEEDIFGGYNKVRNEEARSECANKSLGQPDSLQEEKAILMNVDDEVNLALIQRDLIPSKEAALSVADKNIIVFLGDTGVGKTTAINFLAGRKIISSKEQYGEVLIAQDGLPGFVIGHKGSETRFTRATEIGDKKFLCDAPGLNDTDGVNRDVPNAVGIANVMKVCKSAILVVLLDARSLPLVRGTIFAKSIKDIARFTKPVDPAAVCVFFTHFHHTTREQIVFEIQKIVDSATFREGSPEHRFIRDLLAALDGRHGHEFLFSPTIETNRELYLKRIENTKKLNRANFSSPLSSQALEKLDNGAKAVMISVTHSLSQYNFQSVSNDLNCLKSLHESIDAQSIKIAFEKSCASVIAEVVRLEGHARRAFEAVKVGQAKDEKVCEQLNEWLERLAKINICACHVPNSLPESEAFKLEVQLHSDINDFVSDCAQRAANQGTRFDIVADLVCIVQRMEHYIFGVLDPKTKEYISEMASQINRRIADLRFKAQDQLDLLQTGVVQKGVLFDKTAACTLYEALNNLNAAKQIPEPYSKAANEHLRTLFERHTSIAVEASRVAFSLVSQAQERTQLILEKRSSPSEGNALSIAQSHLVAILCVLNNVEMKYVFEKSFKNYSQLTALLYNQIKQLFGFLDAATVEDDFQNIIVSAEQLQWLGSCVGSIDLNEKLILLFKKLQSDFREAKATHDRIRRALAASDDDYFRLNKAANKLLSASGLDNFLSKLQQEMTIQSMRASLVQGFVEELTEVIDATLRTLASSGNTAAEFGMRCNRLESLFGVQTHIELSRIGAIVAKLGELWEDLEHRATQASELRPCDVARLIGEVRSQELHSQTISLKPQLAIYWKDCLSHSKSQEHQVLTTIMDASRKAIEREKHKCLQEIETQNFVALSQSLVWFEEALHSFNLGDLNNLLRHVYSSLIANLECVISDLVTQIKSAADNNAFEKGVQLVEQIQNAQVLQKHIKKFDILDLVSEQRALLTVKKNSLSESTVNYLSRKQYPKVAEILHSLKSSQSEADHREYTKCDSEVYAIIQDKYNVCHSMAQSDYLPSDHSARDAIANFADCTANFVKLKCLHELTTFPVKASADELVAALKHICDGLLKKYLSEIGKFNFARAGRLYPLLSTFSKFNASFPECKFSAAIAKMHEDLTKLPELIKAAVATALGMRDVTNAVVIHAVESKSGPKSESRPNLVPQKPKNKSHREEKKDFAAKAIPHDTRPPGGAPIARSDPPGQCSALARVAPENINAGKLDFLLEQCNKAKDDDVWSEIDFGKIESDVQKQIRQQFATLVALGNEFVFNGTLENASKIISCLDLLMESNYLAGISNCCIALSALRDSHKAASEDINTLQDPEAVALQLFHIKKYQGQHLYVTAVQKLQTMVERDYDRHLCSLIIEEASRSKLEEVQRLLKLWINASTMMVRHNLKGTEFLQSYVKLGQELVISQIDKKVVNIRKAMQADKVDYDSLQVLQKFVSAFSFETVGKSYEELMGMNNKLSNRLSAFQAANLKARQYISSLDLCRDVINAKALDDHLDSLSHQVVQEDQPVFCPFFRLRDKVIDSMKFVEAFLKDENLELIVRFLRNLETLSVQQKLPELSKHAGDYKERLISIIRTHVDVCKEGALTHYKAKAFRELEGSWVHLANLQAELSAAIPTVFRANVSDELAELFKKELQTIVKQFETGHPIPTLNEMKLFLIQLKRTVSEFSNPIVTKFLKDLITKKLDGCKDEENLDLFQLGVLLSAEGTEGMQIVAEFPHFQAIIIAAQQEASASVSVNDALNFLEKNNTINRAILEEAYSSFDRAFKSYLDIYLLQPHTINDLVSTTKSKAAAICSTKQNWHEICREIPLLLAGIFGVWTITKSAKLSGSAFNHIVIKPHPVQVLTLFRLLGLDAPEDGLFSKFLNFLGHLQSRMKSHIAEIVTGGGKSIILGILATTLALLEFYVHSACYSKYLCERDEADFEDVWELFNVRDLIKFSTLRALADDIITENGDVRALVTQFVVSGGAPLPFKALSEKIPKNRRILLIDEVDVFFSSDFYGSTFNPCTGKISIGVDIQKYIWEHRAQNLNLKDLKELPSYNEIAKKYPRIMKLLDCHFTNMLSDVREFQSPNYVVQEDSWGVKRIGYKSQGTVCFSTSQRYRTSFAYLFESEQKNVLAETSEDQLGIKFRCGEFSFAEIPKEFLCILGVSGTLSTGSAFQQEVIRSFGINSRTITPSIYGKSNLDDDVKGLRSVVENTKQEWFQKITNDAIHAVEKQERAVIIFFDTEEQLQEFSNSEYGIRLLQRSGTTVVTEKTKTAQLDHAIAKSTSVGAITLFPRIFGRGLDFKVFDRKVAQNGGVHVIQTFFSKSASEEIQIKGRTARMKDKGSYQLILCSQILCDPSYMHVDSARLRTAIAKSPADTYTYLVTCRDVFNVRQDDKLKQAVTDASTSHADSTALQKLLTSHPHNVTETLRLLSYFAVVWKSSPQPAP